MKFFLFLWFLAATAHGQTRVGFQTDGRGSRYGDLQIARDRITVRPDGGDPVDLSTENLISIDFHFPRGDPASDLEPPLQKGALAAPWKHATVGRLVAGGSAHGGTDAFHVFTSASHADDPFRSFSMAYQSGPENGHITARLRSIGDRDHESRAGVIIRNGLGKDDGNFMLVIHPGQGSGFRAWRNVSSGYGNGAFSKSIRPPYWVRLIRDSGRIAALISPDGNIWTLIHSIDEATILGESNTTKKEPRVYGLVATSTAADSPFAATFDHVTVGSLDELGDSASAADPRVTLTDGSFVRAPVTTSENGKLIQLGAPWKRTLPSLYVSQIDFFYPLKGGRRKSDSGPVRPGVLLGGGDFIEADFGSLFGGKITVTSRLVGVRSFEPLSEADTVILRAPDDEPGRRAMFKAEFLDGQILYAKAFRVADGEFVFDTTYLGEKSFPVQALRRISKIIP